ncbi:hypothetical protein HG535_0A07820 [Zygotorulaspora mrakii]|uniref:glucan endo-1,3-beta-D-glucosidase n=1 Tax=Zygotorulaspora mrakii TaxID=42260 RepID=A0A7H9AYJ0_ZYGMR|nr:uncharacterized protein HG535_0A07820 [Zygotorulaspora mrakii]QLG70839.1 hypothetical protein HG535_0A07820 [Zygotorulaspora mrakii]
MKFTSSLSAISIAAIGAVSFANADCQMSGGNYYCSKAEAIVYSDVGYSGSYMDVSFMDENSCSCSQSSVQVSGSLAPLDEELSVHFRGPVRLLQFGVYYPAGNSNLNKRDEDDVDCVQTVQKHQHKRDVAVQYVEVTSTVYVNGNGESVTSATAVPKAPGNPETGLVSSYTYVNTILSPSQTDSPSSAAASTTSLSPSPSSSSSSSTGSSSSAPASSSPASSNSGSTGSWVRSSYFQPGSASNCVFMNHQGGTAGSGTWSSCFGNSISFAGSDGLSGASSPQALNDVTIASGKEYMIFSGTECSGDSCGYHRENIPAYHGFGGSDKIFVFEFSMPSDTAGSGYNQDMPAIWLLNAKVPRTLQYGNSDCSCWKTGCGEMDLFEILTAGSDKLISHIHSGQGSNGQSSGGGGSQDYFTRPSSGTLKAAVIFNGSDKSVHIVEVDEDFEAELSSSTVSSWLNSAGSNAQML